MPCLRHANRFLQRHMVILVTGVLFGLLSGCNQAGVTTAPWLGYAEGEYVRVAAPVAGRLTRLDVLRGDSVTAGQPLFTLEQENEQAAKEEAEARVNQAEAQLANLQKGRRPEEIKVVSEQLAQARSAMQLSKVQLERQQALVAQGFVSAASLDAASSSYQSAAARVQELNAQLATTRLPSRPDEIAAARAELAAARQVVAQTLWRVAQKSQNAPVAGRIDNTFYRLGEYVNAGVPVLSILPPTAIKLRFYVPETVLATLRAGQNVQVHCDGCGADIPARISFIAAEAEYTPPVIYSKENRAGLVFLVEARPDVKDAARLHPGLPVEVRADGPATAGQN